MIALKQLKSKVLDPYISALNKKKRADVKSSLNDVLITRYHGDTHLAILATDGKQLYSYLTVNVGNTLGFEPSGVSAISIDHIIADSLNADKVYQVQNTTDIDHLVFGSEKNCVTPFTEEHKFLLKNAHKFTGSETSRQRLTWLNFHQGNSTLFATDGYTALATTTETAPDIVCKTNTFGVPSNILPILSRMSDFWFELNFKIVDGRSWLEFIGVDPFGNILKFGVINASERESEDAPDIVAVIPKGELMCDGIPYSILDDILQKDFINDQFGKDILKGTKSSDILIRFFAFEDSEDLAVQFVHVNSSAEKEISSTTVLPIRVAIRSLDVCFTLEYIDKLALKGINGFESQMMLVAPSHERMSSQPALFHYADNGTTFGILMNRRPLP